MAMMSHDLRSQSLVVPYPHSKPLSHVLSIPFVISYLFYSPGNSCDKKKITCVTSIVESFFKVYNKIVI